MPQVSKRIIPNRKYYVGKKLTKREAMKRATGADKNAGYGDFRGFKYNARTGMAFLC